MRWFKHFSDARRNPKLRLVEKKLGEAGYARWFKLLELVAERGGTGRDFQPRIPDGEYLAAPAHQFANKFRDLKFLVMRGGL
jgi:hypothetical protein